MSEKARVRNKQCKACPWRKDVNPTEDIPNGYCVTKHKNLKRTIAEPGAMVLSGPLHVMACHEAKLNKEYPCVGWLVNQLGPGNNLLLRLQARDGRFNKLQTVGPQHERFEDTLPDDEEIE